MSSWDEAGRCPKCGNPGQEDIVNSLGKRGKVVSLICKNVACKWFNTGWVVQVGPNGEIPDPRPRDKEFPELSGFGKALALRAMEEAAFTDPTIIDKLPIDEDQKAALRIEVLKRSQMS